MSITPLHIKFRWFSNLQWNNNAALGTYTGPITCWWRSSSLAGKLACPDDPYIPKSSMLCRSTPRCTEGMMGRFARLWSPDVMPPPSPCCRRRHDAIIKVWSKACIAIVAARLGLRAPHGYHIQQWAIGMSFIGSGLLPLVHCFWVTVCVLVKPEMLTQNFYSDSVFNTLYSLLI